MIFHTRDVVICQWTKIDFSLHFKILYIYISDHFLNPSLRAQKLHMMQISNYFLTGWSLDSNLKLTIWLLAHALHIETTISTCSTIIQRENNSKSFPNSKNNSRIYRLSILFKTPRHLLNY